MGDLVKKLPSYGNTLYLWPQNLYVEKYEPQVRINAVLYNYKSGNYNLCVACRLASLTWSWGKIFLCYYSKIKRLI